jgi:hypothetical protein
MFTFMVSKKLLAVVLTTGVFLGSLAGMSGAVQAIESGAKPCQPAQVSAEKGEAEQRLGSALAMAKVYRVGEAVWYHTSYMNFKYPGVIIAVHAGRGTYVVRVYFGTGQTEDHEVSPDSISPR